MSEIKYYTKYFKNWIWRSQNLQTLQFYTFLVFSVAVLTNSNPAFSWALGYPVLVIIQLIQGLRREKKEQRHD